MKKIDHRGKTFGKLIVIEQGIPGKGKTRWNCKCQCGNDVLTSSSNLTTGNTSSCGKCDNSPYTPEEKCLKLHYRNYRNNAQSRKREFSIDYIRFVELVLQNCHYCNTPPKRQDMTNYVGSSYSETFRKRLHMELNGIDRLDPNKGYTEDNIVSCCSFCNYAKHRLTPQEYISICKKVAAHCSE